MTFPREDPMPGTESLAGPPAHLADHPFRPTKERPDRCGHAKSTTDAGTFCFRMKGEHPNITWDEALTRHRHPVQSAAQREAWDFMTALGCTPKGVRVDHPHTDPGDGRPECELCGKYVWPVTHSCKGVPVTEAARLRHAERAVPHQGLTDAEGRRAERKATPQRLPIHLRSTDKWTRETQTPGLTVAVDAAGYVVLRVPSGQTFAVTHVDSLIYDLKSAAQIRDLKEKEARP